MNCDELVELVTAYLDGALDQDTERRVEEHLDSCDGCTRYLEQFNSTIESLHGLRPAALDEQTKASLLAAFRAAPH